jgi:hypothetical protein
MRHRGTIVAIAIAAIALGALHEFLFVNLNYQIDHVARSTPYSYAHSLFQGWVAGWPLDALLRMKWLLALAFIGAMLGVTLVFAKVAGASYRHRRIIVLAFAAIGASALLFHALQRWSPELDVLSVKLLHAIQYPVLLFFVWAALTLGRPEHRR